MTTHPDFRLAAAAVLLLWAGHGVCRADTVDARCDIQPKGVRAATQVMACTFSQRQGHVAIQRADGVRHELSPQGAPGNYIDENGRPAHRSKGLGSKGQIYRLAEGSVFVYWDTAKLVRGVAPAPSAPRAKTPSTR